MIVRRMFVNLVMITDDELVDSMTHIELEVSHLLHDWNENLRIADYQVECVRYQVFEESSLYFTSFFVPDC